MALTEDTLTTQPTKKWPGLKGKGVVLNPEDLPRLTAQQMAFVDAVTEKDTTYTDAFLKAYPTAEKWPKPAQWAGASRIAANVKVALWIEHAWKAKARSVSRTVEGHLQRLESAYHKGLEGGQIGAAVQAEKAHAEALGHRSNDGEASVTVQIKTFSQSDQQVSGPILEHEPD